jgi:hypothetical protein
MGRTAAIAVAAAVAEPAPIGAGGSRLGAPNAGRDARERPAPTRAAYDD